MDRTFDARPDNADFRDLLYRPPLINVPAERPISTWLRRSVPVLDQGREGACTGFGLATAIHYLLRTRAGTRDETLVSPRMLYEMAKRYDRWKGEDYDGSSCRGALKGFHKHGVCSAEAWPYESGDADMLESDWPAREADAAKRPLGAYYRVNTHDLTHMHTALAETGVLYVSARVHKGWDRVRSDGIIPFDPDWTEDGGHAFALVGYDDEGFWLQNSWGGNWGHNGCARISYQDWLKFGSDAWALRLGVPVRLS